MEVRRQVARRRSASQHAPNPRRTGALAGCLRVWVVGIAPRERFAGRRIVEAFGHRELDHVFGEQPVVRIVPRELTDAGHVRRHRDATFGNARGDPQSPHLAFAAADDLKRLATGSGAVFLAQRIDRRNRFARGCSTLQRQPHQAVVVEHAVGVAQFASATGRRLPQRHLAIVDQTNHRIGLGDLTVLAAHSIVLPCDQVDQFANLMIASLMVQKLRHERRVRRVGDHHRAIGRRAATDHDAGASIEVFVRDLDDLGGQRGRQDQQE